MNFDDAKEYLAKNYEANGFDIVDIGEKTIHLSYQTQKVRLVVTEEDITEFSNFEEIRAEFASEPVECSMCGKNYREQLVQEIGTPRLLFSILRGVGFSFSRQISEEESKNIHVRVASASSDFTNYFKFHEKYMELCKDRIEIMGHGRHQKTPVDIREHMFRFQTIQVRGIDGQSIKEALESSTGIIESCLFNLSYINRIALWPAEIWPPSRRNRVLNKRNKMQRNLPLPKALYKADLVRFYQLAQSSDGFPVLQFIAYYQILEYFFVTVSDEKLYEQLFRHINDPKFNNNRQNYDRLIQEVLNHRQETDEKQMLKNVLLKFMNIADLKDFIRQFDESYEQEKGEKRFNKKREIFGEMVKLSPESPDDNFLGDIVQRVKVVRNALVHSSDRYSRNERHIPFSESTEVVSEEIPLVRFLAEKVIIATAEKNF